MERVNIIKPGFFTIQAHADSRRLEFDTKNEIIVANKTNVDFVFVGDSITNNWELNAYFGGSNRIIINRGISGDTPVYLLRRFEADVLQLKPKYAVMMIGINNTWVLDDMQIQHSLDKLKTDVIEKTLNEINQIVKLCKNAGQNLIICSILPTNLAGSSSNNERNRLICDLNNEIEMICKRDMFTYVDYHSKMTFEDGKTLKDGFSEDGVHPHIIGYNKMAYILRHTLSEKNITI